MDELTCRQCHTHVAWIHDAGPRGYIMCDTCRKEELEKEELEEEENNDEQSN